MGFHLFDENEEMDFIIGNTYDNLQIGQYNKNFSLNPEITKNFEDVVEKFQLPADVALPYVLAGGTADMSAGKQIAEDIAFNATKNKAQIWTELQQKYQYEET